jgi:hypothetical protein
MELFTSSALLRGLFSPLAVEVIALAISALFDMV